MKKINNKEVMEGLLNNVHLGNNLELIKQIPDNFVDFICTDPP